MTPLPRPSSSLKVIYKPLHLHTRLQSFQASKHEITPGVVYVPQRIAHIHAFANFLSWNNQLLVVWLVLKIRLV